jgi:hypothetical protein
MNLAIKLLNDHPYPAHHILIPSGDIRLAKLPPPYPHRK